MEVGNIKIEHLLGANSDLDEAYESKNEDGEDAYYTTATSTNNGTPKYATSALIRSIDDPGYQSANSGMATDFEIYSPISYYSVRAPPRST